MNITSVGGYIGNATRAYYCAGKFGTQSRVLSHSRNPRRRHFRFAALEGFTEAFTKEMVPEWNIRGVIIQPGGFRTEWGRSSMVTLPLPPQYDRPDAPSVKFRQLLEQNTFMGEPHKAALAIVQIASLPDPPLRFQVGTDAVLSVRQKALQTVADTEKYEKLAHSTNADGVDSVRVLEMIRDGTQAKR